METRDINGGFGITFQSGDSLNVSGGRNYEFLEESFPIVTGVRIPVGSYAFGDVSASMQFGNQRKMSGSVSATYGSFYNGNRTQLSYSGGRIELSPQFSLEPGVSLNLVDLEQGSFKTRLLSNRATYTVTPRMFLTGLVQYNSSSHALSSNLRARWEYHPGSELFVVYTDERDTTMNGYPDLRNRAFVVKINRNWRF